MHHFPKRPFSLKSALADYGSAHKKYRWVRVGNACTCVVVPKDLSRRTRTPAVLQRCSESCEPQSTGAIGAGCASSPSLRTSTDARSLL